MTEDYLGKYVIAKPTSKEEAGKLLGSDNIIGDVYKVVNALEGTTHTSKVLNRFKDSPAFFDEDISRELSLNEAKGMITYAILTCVGFTQIGNDGDYWAEFIVISFPKKDIDIFSVYIDEVSKAIKNNKRPKVDLSQAEIKEVINNEGKYISSSKHPQIEKKKGQVVLKSRVKLTDKMVEEGRKRNPGCFIFGWLFLLLFVTFLVFVSMKIFNF